VAARFWRHSLESSHRPCLRLPHRAIWLPTAPRQSHFLERQSSGPILGTTLAPSSLSGRSGRPVPLRMLGLLSKTSPQWLLPCHRASETCFSFGCATSTAARITATKTVLATSFGTILTTLTASTASRLTTTYDFPQTAVQWLLSQSTRMHRAIAHLTRSAMMQRPDSAKCGCPTQAYRIRVLSCTAHSLSRMPCLAVGGLASPTSTRATAALVLAFAAHGSVLQRDELWRTNSGTTLGRHTMEPTPVMTGTKIVSTVAMTA